MSDDKRTIAALRDRITQLEQEVIDVRQRTIGEAWGCVESVRNEVVPLKSVIGYYIGAELDRAMQRISAMQEEEPRDDLRENIWKQVSDLRARNDHVVDVIRAVEAEWAALDECERDTSGNFFDNLIARIAAPQEVKS